ncbi:LOW QUALITY PROTEIN: heparan sulfate glucosamine 3-O-sulfotransferase 1-like [Lingula anatina]|uniref:LOW QUALITY PROTEIN: heparan sulfate glucosamine 3-O-sulfotransferase 1-like n=1 Tax=Lingula anatina TaxID=7574 RepID=A0A1S3ICR1_LINAN|nr:LOW QUALITY PROTEIN: heparan sulfate glucosamine 3-O-sulfotransferase 1-like [Lingula anatina]|eukprot:XP_013396027.1 LOW QUALITY PROTEIN: heparan sulfate glucosamine 3-O-sulfotransferase 1-like [Lingula anatina]
MTAKMKKKKSKGQGLSGCTKVLTQSQSIQTDGNSIDSVKASSKFCSCRQRVLAIFLLIGIVCCFCIYGIYTSSGAHLKSDLSSYTEMSSNTQHETQGDYDFGVDSYPFHSRHTQRRLPQCIIIGVRKGGTRALLNFLDLHPDIQTAGREMHFFDEPDRYKLGLNWYRKRMPFSFRNQITIEKTPAYFVEEHVAGKVHEMNSSIKLLLILRDPVERMISDYLQVRTNKEEKGKSYHRFEDLVIDKETGGIRESYTPVRRSKYHVHMARWLKYFSLDQFLLISSERFAEDPVTQLQRVEAFLDIDPQFKRDMFVYNETKGFYCIRDEDEHVCLGESKGRKHPNIDPAVLAKLRAFFRPQNKKFYSLVGVNFGWP